MQKLISELARLYLAPGQHAQGVAGPGLRLAACDGVTRAVVIPFHRIPAREAQHWTRLCEVANALQAELGLPAPAVSVSATDGYALWLSFESPIPLAQAQTFLTLLRAAYFPDLELGADAGAPVDLPPYQHRLTGKWSAFIHPGLGASFADEAGLDMAPPLTGQVALLEGLHSISAAQFADAMNKLQQAHGAPPPASPALPARDALLLKDATLEDIVRHLHAMNIEPTLRHLIVK